MSNFDKAFAVVLEHEGGFVDHASDPGGATNRGISLRYLLDRGDLDGDGLPDGDIDGDGDVDADDVRDLSWAHAKAFYHSGFWVPNRFPEVEHDSIATKIFDMAVNMGGRQAWRIAQRACNELCEPGDELEVDGLVGPKTLMIVNAVNAAVLLMKLRQHQLKFYFDLIDRRPSLAVFRDGWENRAMA